jgi:hypothetical protein
MQGLIFVTWEKYLAERFGSPLLHTYRSAIGETAATAPLVSRVYDDATLLAGVGAACQLTGLPADTLLREYGRYFILNGLARHLRAYLLDHVHSGAELLLAMRDVHAQMRRTPDALTPPLFGYETLSPNPNDLTLIYDSPRKVCALLWGCIEGAAERYGERVQIVERTCMQRGAAACRFEIHFYRLPSRPLSQQETPLQEEHQRAKRELADLVFTTLPTTDGVTLGELQWILGKQVKNQRQLRPSILLEALRHLQYVGLAASTTNNPGEDLLQRRYWRAPTSDV